MSGMRGAAVTTWDVARALGRFWFVAVYLAGVTVIVALLVANQPGVYWGQTRVQFYEPAAPSANRLESGSRGLTATAGLVQRMVSGEIHQSESAGAVTLPGRGVRHGSSVVLPNTGGQWAANFPSSMLEVEAVGPSRADVAGQLDDTIARIERALRELQAESAIAPQNLMTAAAPPDGPTIHYRGVRSLRAGGVVLLLGLAISVTVPCLLDRWAQSRRRRAPAGVSAGQQASREAQLLRSP